MVWSLCQWVLRNPIEQLTNGIEFGSVIASFSKMSQWGAESEEVGNDAQAECTEKRMGHEEVEI